MTRHDARMVAEELYKLMEQNEVFPNRYMDINEASKMTTIPKGTIYNKVCHNEIPYLKMGKRLVFSERALRLFIEGEKRG